MKNDSLRFQKFRLLFTWSSPRRSSLSLTMSESISSKNVSRARTPIGTNLPSSRYRGFEYNDRGTTANLIFSNCFPLIPVRWDNRSFVSLKISPCHV